MEHLTFRRRAIKAKITRISTFVENPRLPETKADSVILCQGKLDALNEAFRDFTELQAEIILKLDLKDKSATEEYETYEAGVEETYYSTKAKLANFVVVCSPEPKMNESMTEETMFAKFIEQQTQLITELGKRTTQGQSSELKLQPLKIPQFSGEYKDWTSFHDIFKTAVHDNLKLSDAQKLQYLKESLTGNAFQLIKHISITDANYDEAWEMVAKRFDKKQHVVQSLIRTVMECPKISSATSTNIRGLLNNVDEVTRSLKALGENGIYENRDPWLIYIILEKLDTETKKLWSVKSLSFDMPTLKNFCDFIDTRCDAMESFGGISGEKSTSSQKTNVKNLHSSPVLAKISPNSSVQTSKRVSNNNCPLCTDKKHPLYYCPTFKKFHVSSRWEHVRSNKICSVCLSKTHVSSECPSEFVCRLCKEKHHNLLHDKDSSYTSSNPTASTSAASHSSAEPSTSTSLIANYVASHVASVSGILPTAIINVVDSRGNNQPIRAMFDTGSQSSLITESCIQRLGLSRENARLSVNGLSSVDAGITRGQSVLELSSRFDKDSKITIKALILKKLTASLPSKSFEMFDWNSLKTIQLADPEFNKSKPIDLIIGTNKLFKMLRSGEIESPDGSVIAKNTMFGWIISGELDAEEPTNSITGLTVNIDQTLRKFWEIEEMPEVPILTLEETICEDHFLTTHTRNDSGRYIVRLPFKISDEEIGRSVKPAVSRLLAMEKRFKYDEGFFQQYKKFMNEYLEINHMELIPNDEINNENVFYLPHHAVIRESSTTTKLRVVFDASASSSSGVSLNDKLLVGPTVQDNLFTNVLRFRSHQYAFSSDIEKMYRQVLIHPNDTDYQRIVWRDSPEKSFDHYRLRTVTYGTASAPFLATRALNQIGKDNESLYPDAAKIIQRDFYVDDLLSGHNNLNSAIQLQEELIKVLRSGGFELRKWSANHSDLLTNIPSEHRGMDLVNLTEDSNVKTLGIYWQPTKDFFLFQINLPDAVVMTKRHLLSDASRLFDPLGWLAPSVVLCKILFQRLWLMKLNWDDELPPEIAGKWLELRSTLPALEEVKINRWIASFDSLELHGFCDASEEAFAAVVYGRAIDSEGCIHVNLVASKNKVAPLKQVSIPRLELCGAVLLVRLLNKIKSAFSHINVQIYCHTDSMIVLAWLASPPRRWTTFIANRTSEVITSYPASHWHHVSSKNNPADVASRGLLPKDLIECKIWWKGPDFLSTEVSNWPSAVPPSYDVHLEERKPKIKVLIAEEDTSLVFRYSCLEKLKRVTATCLRFAHNCKKNSERLTELDVLSTTELQNALMVHIKDSQQRSFGSEIKLCLDQKPIGSNSKLSKLHPFTDDKGVLRVGGRLQKANLSYSAKHPIILSSKEQITLLLIKSLHIQFFHANFTLLTNILFQNYWIIGFRDVVRRFIQNCLICFKHKAKLSSQMMGELPTARITENRAFSHVGCDYAGPIWLKRNKGRSATKDKGYIALFVCMSTKAIHLEIVSSLSTDAFIAALKRFVARRGHCSDIYTDNGTNFVGANRELKDLHQLLMSQKSIDALSRHLSSQGTTWHFNPPLSPHFGGLWEAGVKAMKYHLYRVLNNSILTFEEMATVLAQIEACLNSRPLCQMSSDPQDEQPLTPGHFLIGAPLTSIPEPNLDEINIGRLDRWQLMQKLHMDFWNRWRLEYLNTLNQRNKWTSPAHNLKIGDLVLVNEAGVPSCQWPTGRITEVFPGADQRVRVVIVRTKSGDYKRSVHQLCKLPIG